MNAPSVVSSTSNSGTNPFTNKPCLSTTILKPDSRTLRSLLMKQQQIICRRKGDAGAKIDDIHMVITGVREGNNKPAPNHMEREFTVVGFSILPKDYGELITSTEPNEIYVTNSGELDIRDVRRINHFHKLEAVKWLSVTVHGGAKTVVKAHDLQQNAEGLFFYKIPGGKRQWHGTHFIIDPEQTKSCTRMMLRQHFDQLRAYENPLEEGTFLEDKKGNEYIVLRTFPPRDVNGKYVDMLIVNGSMEAPMYAFSYEFQVINPETKK